MYDQQKNKAIIIISLISIAAGITVMFGWIFNILALRQIVPGFVVMVFNTALCFVFFGSALLLTQYQTGKYQHPAFFVLSLFCTLIGLITLLQFLLHFNIGLDELFVTDPQIISGSHLFAGRMAFNATICVLLLGLGFLLLTTKNRLFNLLAQYFFHAVTILSAIALIGYLYGVSLFDSLFYVSSMATHTAILFFVLSLAASLINPSMGITRLFTDKRIGNKMAKRLFTLMLIMVILFGSFGVQTQHYRLFTLQIGISLVAVCFLLISLVIIWNTATWLNGIDARRSEAEAKVKLMNADLEKRVEERTRAVQKSEAKYRSLIEQASDAIYVLDMNGNFTDVNDSMCKMIGYTRGELLQLNVAAIIDPEELKTDPLPKSIENPERSKVRERRFMRRDKHVFPVEINVKMFSDNMILVIARDITYRKKMETELKEAELKFRTIAEKSMVGVYMVQNGRFIYVNPRFAEVFGYRPEELINTVPVEAIIDESYRHITTENIRKRMTGEVESINYEIIGLKKDGSANWVEFYGSRAIIAGEPVIMGSMIDITERKHAEELILNEKILSDTIINSLPGVFYLRDANGKYLRWNTSFEIVTGYTAKEIEGLNADDLISKEDLEMVKAEVEKVFTEGYAMVEAKAITKDGTKISYLLTGSPIIYENKWCLLGIGIDISSRIKAEEELRLSEQKYKLIFESNPLPLWMIEKDSLSIIAVNEAAANLYGYTIAELLNKSVKILRPEEDMEEQLEGYRKNISTSTDLRIVRHLKKDGTIMFVQIMAHDIIFDGRAVRLSLTNDITEKLRAEESLQKSEANLQTILKTTDTAYALFDTELKVLAFNQKAIEFAKEHYHHVPQKGERLADVFRTERLPHFLNLAKQVLNGTHINYEIDYPRAADGSVYWFEVRLSPLTSDSDKGILGMLITLYDITERKNTEQNLKRAYERIQSQVNSIKDMAWKQSHLMRSPVANLKALASILKDHPSDSETLAHFQKEIERLDAIIHEMAKDASDYDI
ncbi:MAG: domain S-box protein [Mucilaginibacter sp.]|nr:domain S-box protein [Mucilaginibacter sp.]